VVLWPGRLHTLPAISWEMVNVCQVFSLFPATVGLKVV
jgi:hypothetical protein